MQYYAYSSNVHNIAWLEAPMGTSTTHHQDLGDIATPRQAGIYVRRAREEKGLTRAKLASAAGVSERLVASLELGDATGIRLDKLLSILGPLEITLTARLTCDNSDTTSAKAEAQPHHQPSDNESTPDENAAGTEQTPTYSELFAQIAHGQGIDMESEEGTDSWPKPISR